MTGLDISHIFFFNDTATTEIYTLSLHDALPIFEVQVDVILVLADAAALADLDRNGPRHHVTRSQVLGGRSEEHTSELQSPCNLVCRLLLEKKKTFVVETLFLTFYNSVDYHLRPK